MEKKGIYWQIHNNHNAPQQEIAEPPAKLIPENQDPQQGADFNHPDPKEPAAHTQQIHKPSAYVKQLQCGSFILDE